MDCRIGEDGRVPPSNVITVRQLTRTYGDRVALDGCDLTVAAGECVALLGHNGSGKTTALRTIAGQLTPTSGTVRVAGADPYLEPEAVQARAALAAALAVQRGGKVELLTPQRGAQRALLSRVLGQRTPGAGYDEAAARDARRRIVAFFDDHLRG